ncbi:33474_t:CDS:2 [Gigaspora margarita]|uniref:33474_t:CDS:1 n=1 Tax=Gigaspora margarita TaxID=4874 RepID=A0ABN7X5A9_GIGMA|nr:33474_t:CDS:2 [Gigaspora margarita]
MSYIPTSYNINLNGMLNDGRSIAASVFRSRKNNNNIDTIDQTYSKNIRDLDIEIISFTPIYSLNKISYYNFNNIQFSNSRINIYYKRPFAPGGLKNAYKRKDYYNNNLVIKEFKTSMNSLEMIQKEILTALTADFFAKQFNLQFSKKIHFETLRLINYNNHLYFLENDVDAFTHFTYHHSNNNLVICDLQGNLNSYNLTNPAINSGSQFFGATDLGEQGIRNIMMYHDCNKTFCSSIGLPSLK